jgi:glycosyltransferase involved in cell wall biosynthesis
MKVAMITPWFYPVLGGTEIYVDNISSKLNEKGIITDIITFDLASKTANSKKSTSAINGTRVIKIPCFKMPESKLLQHMLNVNLVPKNQLSLLKEYDILHFNNDADLSFPIFSYPIRKPKILHCHNIGPTYFYFKINPMSGFVMKNATDRLIASSDYALSLLNQLGISRDRISLIPNGVDTEKFTPNSSMRPENVLLYVGRIEPGKGLHYLIRALKSISTPMELMIAGPRSRNESYNIEIFSMIEKENALSLHKITYLGELTSDQLADLYKKVTLLVLPSLNETFGIVLLEAMASGTPIVASKSGGMPEIIGENGVLFESGNPVDLARKIEYLLQDKSLRTRMGINGRRLVQENFSYDRVAQKLIEVYQQMLSKSH